MRSVIIKSFGNGTGLMETGRYRVGLYPKEGKVSMPRNVTLHLVREFLKMQDGKVTHLVITMEGYDGREVDSLGRRVAHEPVQFDRTLGARATAWRKHQGYSSDPNVVGLKLVEEIGELVRAYIGELEKRPNRGDFVQEAAQAAIVLASFFYLVHPESDLFQAVREEMKRLGV